MAGSHIDIPKERIAEWTCLAARWTWSSKKAFAVHFAGKTFSNPDRSFMLPERNDITLGHYAKTPD